MNIYGTEVPIGVIFLGSIVFLALLYSLVDFFNNSGEHLDMYDEDYGKIKQKKNKKYLYIRQCFLIV